jgi:hypothetical protein
MYLKSFTLKNFRKFQNSDNIILFVPASMNKDHKNSFTIDIASKTTLILGKNNSGKTTIMTALKKLVTNQKFGPNDFNNSFLFELVEKYKELNYLYRDINEIDFPYIEFTLIIGLDDNQKNNLSQVKDFITDHDIEKNNEVTIKIKVTIKEQVRFVEEIKKLDTLTVDGIRKIINSIGLQVLNFNKLEMECPSFNLNQLMELTSISANNIKSDHSLTQAFSNIIKYSYKNRLSDSNSLSTIDKFIDRMNTDLNKELGENFISEYRQYLRKIFPSEEKSLSIKSDLTIDKLLTSAIRYEYSDNGLSVPENQYGLGYTNLIVIISEILSYIEKDVEKSFTSQVNIISIEEPETYMHPQMQEMFIKKIEDLMNEILRSKDKEIHCQIIVTTHSPHILNSKIHQGKKFDVVNYVKDCKEGSKVIAITNSNIVDGISEEKADFKFIKKHFKYDISDIFFSDAIILVEGITEYRLFQYLLDHDERLNKYFVSLILVNGAHAKVYLPLIKLLSVPTLIITDIDYKRTKEEKENFSQITSSNRDIIFEKQKLFDIFKDRILKHLEQDARNEKILTKFKKDLKSVAYKANLTGFYPENKLNYIVNELVSKNYPSDFKLKLKKVRLDHLCPIENRRETTNFSISSILGTNDIKKILEHRYNLSVFDFLKTIVFHHLFESYSKMDIDRVSLVDYLKNVPSPYFIYHIKNCLSKMYGNKNFDIEFITNLEWYKNFINKNRKDSRLFYQIHDSIILSFQNSSINRFYPTSFEESYILSNSNNDTINRLLTEINILDNDDKIKIERSYKYQSEISIRNKKSEFANELLYKLYSCCAGEEIPKVPNYIDNGIDGLVTLLGRE